MDTIMSLNYLFEGLLLTLLCCLVLFVYWFWTDECNFNKLMFMWMAVGLGLTLYSMLPMIDKEVSFPNFWFFFPGMSILCLSVWAQASHQDDHYCE